MSYRKVFRNSILTLALVIATAAPAAMAAPSGVVERGSEGAEMSVWDALWDRMASLWSKTSSSITTGEDPTSPEAQGSRDPEAFPISDPQG